MKMKVLFWAVWVLSIILLGLFSYFLINSSVENPLSTFSTFGSSFFEKPSPGNWVKENQIVIYPDRVVIFVSNATLSRYANTNSMLPFFDDTANGIEIKPSSPQDIHIGDVIAYESGGSLIVHRVVKIGTDEQGWFCIAKGDNSPVQDEGRIRFKDIEYVTIMIIY